LPEGVSLHFTRLKLTGSSDAEILGMVERVEEAALLLADAEPGRILFHCTAVTTFAPEIVAGIQARMIGICVNKPGSTSDYTWRRACTAMNKTVALPRVRRISSASSSFCVLIVTQISFQLR